MDRTIRILQLTDLHLYGDSKKKLLSINSQETLNKVIEALKKDLKETKADLITITGDLSQDFTIDSYQFVHEICATLPALTTLILGNHDDRTIFEKIFGKLLRHHFIFANWQLILLNSHWPNHIAGFLTDDDLLFLDTKLSANRNKSTLIFVHHHTLLVNCPWLDSIAITNSQQLLKVIDRHKNIKAVICGHIHQESQTRRNNVDFFSTPSTCFQFAPHSQAFQLDPLMPGYRWIDLYSDGHLATGVIRIEYDANFLPPIDSKGY